jgi:peptidyl-prolyl cis-trans isomerase B (cyclophilin B)
MKTATIVTSRGTIQIKLFDAECPGTVLNFEKLANSKFYDGQKWHRVIKDFMIQGGDPLSRDGGPGVGTGGPGYKIECEIRPTLKHGKGTLPMAHAGSCEHDPDTGKKLSGTCSNGSQFFITHLPTPHLDGIHTVFGQVTAGQDVVDAIQQNDEIVSIRVEG